MKKNILRTTLLLSLILPAGARAQTDRPFTFDTVGNSRPSDRTFTFEPPTATERGNLATRNDSDRTATTAQSTTRQGEPRNSPGVQQRSADRKSQGHWVFGGGLGLSFGRYTSVNISPEVGYRFNRFFTLGAGLSYNFFEHRDRDYSLNYLGAYVYGRAYPIPYVVLLAQPELQRRWGRVDRHTTDSEVFGCLLLGGGLSLPVGYRGRMELTFYYDVLQNDYSPHGTRVGYSVGYVFGF